MRRLIPLAAVAALLAGTVGAAPAFAAGGSSEDQLTDYVNPFIGTQNEGNNFPGAAVPFGMVQLSPDTGHNTGYDYDEKSIRGFSSVHLAGVGCGLGGDLPVMPTTGDITKTDNADYAAPFSHDKESASPGSYKVALDTGITAELSATEHTGYQRYTFPETEKANVLLNSGQSLHKISSSSVRVLNDRTIATEIDGSGFCQDTKGYKLYAITKFDRPFASYGTWSGDTVTAGSKGAEGGGKRGAYARFDTTKGDRSVGAVTAISYVDARGAARNLAAEGGDSFDRTKAKAQRTWERRLEQVKVQGGSDERRRTFYSALYRALLHPNTGTDVDGRYTGWDQKIHRAGKDFTYYQNWSLWDTYRTQAQLLSLLAPDESRDMALSLLKIDQQGGWLPKWGYGTVETNIMTGDPVTPFLTNAYRQGLLRGHEEEAYAALKKNADGVPPADSQYAGRAGNAEYLKDGYVPLDPDHPHKPGDNDFQHGASATLEYALSDAALSEMARKLGHEDDAKRYAERSQNYRELVDPETNFFRARDTSGAFTSDPDPAKGEGFHEGTSWQYTWLVPQDIPGLMEVIGGREATEKRLDSFFAYEELLKDPEKTARETWVNGAYDYYNADKYNPQNEPDLIAPYTYLSTGSPYKTTDVVHAALTLFTNAPNGVTGNDDLGTMSSWMVLSSMGVFPVFPGTDTWGLSTPVFDRVDLKLDRRYFPRGHLGISAEGTSDTDRYIQSVAVDGAAQSHTWLSTDELRGAGEVSFEVGAKPSEWGTGAGDAPPSTQR
ncbi:GH92 family glycosyl hydrolase [Streptomyces boninensis]|uniref:GH92 family glycosyl hydrolase n=1 Tax=Streptomyces boninensis TaxID=2039455 RepID=UPI003B228109